MHRKSQGKITYVLQAITIIPLFFFAVIVMMLSYRQFANTMYAEIETELENAAHDLKLLLDVAYPGDYRLVGDTALQLYKGESDITSDYSLFDALQANTGMDATLFYQDTRILTTIRDKNHERIVGTGAVATVLEDVLNTGKPHFYFNTQVNKQEYFSYYMPLTNSDGTVVGMLFVGKPTASIKNAVMRSLYPLLISVVMVMLVIAVCIFIYTRKFTAMVFRIREFLNEVSTGNLNGTLDPSVSRRNDEIGDIGRSVVNMQHALRNMIEQDTLTELYNRRSGNRRLQNIIDKASAQGSSFSVSIGDIDFFKKVNDTYGHDCGDEVLRRIARKLKEHMRSQGFVARWGGEEFLLVFDHKNQYEAQESLQKLLDDIRALAIPYGDKTIHVTMTFGVTENTSSDINQLIKEADDKLYLGKSGGRNCIVV